MGRSQARLLGVPVRARGHRQRGGPGGLGMASGSGRRTLPGTPRLFNCTPKSSCRIAFSFSIGANTWPQKETRFLQNRRGARGSLDLQPGVAFASAILVSPRLEWHHPGAHWGCHRSCGAPCWSL